VQFETPTRENKGNIMQVGILSEANLALTSGKLARISSRGGSTAKGHRHPAREIGLMASLGYSQVKAIRRPVVAVLSTAMSWASWPALPRAKYTIAISTVSPAW